MNLGRVASASLITLPAVTPGSGSFVTASGKIGSGLNFPVTGSSVLSLIIGRQSDISLPNRWPTADVDLPGFSYTLWAKIDSYGSQSRTTFVSYLINTGSIDSYNGVQFGLQHLSSSNGGNMYMFWGDPSSANQSFPYSLGFNTWNFIYAGYDHDTGKAEISINNAPITKSSSSKRFTLSNRYGWNRIFTGDQGGGGAKGTDNVTIDEYAMWKKPLTSDEISTIYNGGVGYGWPGINSASLSHTTSSNNVLTITASIPIINEDSLDYGEFIINRTSNTSRSLDVNYTMSGTAINGVNYNALSGQTTIPYGQYSSSIRIYPIPTATGIKKATLSLNRGVPHYSRVNPFAQTVTIIGGGGNLFSASAFMDFPNGTTTSSIISVSGLTGVISDVTVEFVGLTLSHPTDFSTIELDAPEGGFSLLMLGGAGETPISGSNIIFNDAGDTPPTDPFISGLYQPEAILFGDIIGGSDPNGDWTLLIDNSFGTNSGSMSGGWTLRIFTE